MKRIPKNDFKMTAVSLLAKRAQDRAHCTKVYWRVTLRLARPFAGPVGIGDRSTIGFGADSGTSFRNADLSGARRGA
jgi:hypothetical protein